MQFITIIGHLTADPETRATTNGNTVCTFTVGVTRAHKNVAGEKESDFFRITTWRQQADFCKKYLSKGMKVFVRGELAPRMYQGKDGRTRLSLYIQADAVEIMSEKKEKSTNDWQDISSKDLPWEA